MELQLTGGPGAGRRIAVSQERTAVTGRWVVGRDPGCHLVLADPDVSRRHVEIDLTRATVRDLGSTNGTGFAALDGTPLRPVGGHPEPWPDGAHLALGSCRLALRAARGGPRAAVHPDGAGHVLVNRAPRLRPAGGAVTVDYPPSPPPPVPTRMPWATALLPLVVAVPMALIWHQPAFLAFAVLSPLAALTQYLIDRRSRRAQQAVTLEEYTRECAARDRDVAEHCAAQSLRRHADHPDLAALAADIVGDRRPGGRLWERRPGDDDQLWLRLGLADLPAELSVRRDGRTTVPVLGSVPLLLDLAAVRVLGIHGPRRAREALAHSLIGQLAGYCSPREVRLAVLTAGREHRWQWIDRLPHAGPAPPGTGSVVLLDEADLLRRRPDVAALLAADDTLAICLAHSHEQLPQECAAVVRLGPDGDASQGILHRRGHPPTTFVADLPDAGWAEQLAAALADLRDATPEPAGAELPDAVPLLDLVATSPAEIARGWLDGGDPTRLGAALGRTTGGVWSVDLVADGPHVLVAGTTGAGKSELLTTLVSALATAHGPDRLAFLLVDYKGGTAFAHLAGVPHVTGVITDLDAALAHRALTSLRAELRRRERWLTGHAERPASGLPRLVIVVDEFRVLAEEQPDLLAGLVRVATVGRGLGVHLVLATQRPAGVVSADIKANANLRIALRLRERADSDDVVDSPDASGLDPSRPGRAVVRRGGGDLVAVQVAQLCGVDRDRWLTSVQAAARLIGARTPPAPWLPPLPDRLTDADLELVVAPRTGSPALPYALADLPEQQRRAVLCWDLTDDGHLAVVGGPGSGRSTVLRTLAAVAGRAGGIHVHVIDAGADLSDLADPARRPHVGTVVAAHDVER
ncbi:MAG: FtsK/SpoIIIE domain-containing protein, partial [Kineosporiaceae bacterium]